MIHLSFGFSIVSIHVVVSLSIGTAESEHEHVVNVWGASSARALESFRPKAPVADSEHTLISPALFSTVVLN